jgi:8-oxo-dGTP pyrophosphatase MutT (NUDIX family)
VLYRQSVRAIVLKEQAVLSMKRNKFGTEYYTLIGGGVDLGEDRETALRRELREEAGLDVGMVRLVFVEDGGDLYGPQFIYFCEYIGGEPVLDTTSEEAKISALGQNIYEPVWLPLDTLLSAPFRSSSIARAILAGVHSGFPETPQELAWKPESVTK